VLLLTWYCTHPKPEDEEVEEALLGLRRETRWGMAIPRGISISRSGSFVCGGSTHEEEEEEEEMLLELARGLD